MIRAHRSAFAHALLWATALIVVALLTDSGKQQHLLLLLVAVLGTTQLLVTTRHATRGKPCRFHRRSTFRRHPDDKQ